MKFLCWNTCPKSTFSKAVEKPVYLGSLWLQISRQISE